MKESRARALVLWITPRGERDATLEILSAEGGREFLTARGFRASRRRFPGLDLFAVAQLELSFSRRGAELAEARLLCQYPRLQRDSLAYALACTDLEWARLFLRSGEGGDFLPLLEQALEQLDQDPPAEPAHLLIWLHFLAAFGYAPELNRCRGCGRELSAGPARFDPDHGEFFCGHCRPTGRRLRPVSAGLQRTLQQAAKDDIRRLPRLKLARSEAHQALELLLDLGRLHSGKEFRSAGFLRQVLGLKGVR